ncbi:transcriptional repressor, partial [bacterium]|nr:transcriptional repressor [bacterium]
LATVYRNLNLMAENGEILRLQFIDGTYRFDRTTRRHAHAFCTVCREVWDIDPRALTVNGLYLPREFQTISCDAAVKGVCGKCAKRRS